MHAHHTHKNMGTRIRDVYEHVYEYPCFYGCGAHASTVVPRPFLTTGSGLGTNGGDKLNYSDCALVLTDHIICIPDVSKRITEWLRQHSGCQLFQSL